MVDFGNDRYPDVLQNIEFAIVEAHRSNPELRDADVDAALSGLITAHNARQQGKAFDPAALRLNERSEAVFQAVGEICEWRIQGEAPRRPRFGTRWCGPCPWW